MSLRRQGRVCSTSDILSLVSYSPFRSALSFHAVSFGLDAHSTSLRRMVQIATEIHDAAPQDPLAPPGNPCSYSKALDTVRRSNSRLRRHSQTFLDSTHQYLFSDRRLATQSQSGSQAYGEPSLVSLIVHDNRL